MIPRFILLVLLGLSLPGCRDEARLTAPPPATMTADAVGYYCHMNLVEHEGPKAQIHVAGAETPLWFSQVRDAVAFTRLPEETADIRGFYVSDMGKAANWSEPGADNWIDARQALFVVESRQPGGMGAPEAIPFGERQAADAYAAANGGRVLRLTEIPDSYVLAPVNVSSAGQATGEARP